METAKPKGGPIPYVKRFHDQPVDPLTLVAGEKPNAPKPSIYLHHHQNRRGLAPLAATVNYESLSGISGPVKRQILDKTTACCYPHLLLRLPLEKAGFSDLTEKLSQWMNKKNPLPVKLEPSMPTRGCKKDERWMILVNIDVEGDL